MSVRKALEKRMYTALRANDFATAIDLAHWNGCRLAGDPHQAQTQWALDARNLDLIFTATPGLLGKVPGEVMETLRLVAAMQYLLAEATPPQIVRFGDDFVPGTHIRTQYAPNQLLKHIEFLANLEQYEEHALKRPSLLLTIQHSGDHEVCPSCRKLPEMRFRIREVYELPNPFCTCEKGCRCSLLPVLR